MAEPENNLGEKARAATLWSGLDTVFREGFGFIIVVILARLLAPEDFGTLALLAFFLGIANVMVNAGFSVALIQMQNTSLLDESTIFWFNLCTGMVMALALWQMSPFIANFFELEQLSPLAKFMAINLMVNSLGGIHSTLLTKALDFKRLMRIGAFATGISGAIAILLAINGFGVWSLAWQALISSAVSTSLLWFWSPWRPMYKFSTDSFRKLFAFGGWVFASNMLEEVYQRGYALLIGKQYGTYELGIYKQADNIQLFPARLLTGVLSRVSFPLFSSAGHDKPRLKRWVRLSVRSNMLICAPTMVGLGVLADPIIAVVFGTRWLPAAPILQVLCCIGFLWPLHVINISVLQAQGHSKLNFRLSVAKKATGIVFLLIGSLFGVMGIAWSRVIHSIFSLLINGKYSKKLLDYRIQEQIWDCLSSFLLSFAMGLLLVFLNQILEIGGIAELAILIVAGASFYLATNLLLGTSAFWEAYNFMRGSSNH